ncbi:MAG: RHS repeat-associated core domain-containing protein, partial [Myxococcota bacterium]
QVQIEDEAGNVRVEIYDGMGHVVERQTPDGTVTEMEYGTDGRLLRTHHPWGAVEQYLYNSRGLTTQTTVTEGSTTRSTTRSYNARGQVTREVDPDGRIITTEYDIMGRPVWKVLGEPDATYRTLEQHSYDELDRPVLSELNGVVTRRTYDLLGRIEVEQVGYTSDPIEDALLTTTRTWTDRDQVETQTDSEGNTLTTTYDALGRLHSTQHTQGDGTDLGTRTVYYDEMGRARLELDELGLDSQQGYDLRGRLIEQTHADLGDIATTTYSINPGSLRTDTGGTITLPSGTYLTQTTSPTGEKVDTYTDGQGRPILIQNAMGGVTQESYANGLKTHSSRYSVDSSGNLTLDSVKMIDYYEDSNRIHRDWDWMSASDYTSCVGADPICNHLGHVTMEYTSGGLTNKVTDASGNDTIYTYSTDGLMMLQRIDRDGVADMAYAYDTAYPIITTVTLDPDGTPLTQTLIRERNMRVTDVVRSRTVTAADGTVEHQQETIALSYDQLGRIEQADFTNRDGTRVRIDQTHNARGQLTSKRYTLGSDVYNPIEWSYRSNGTLRTMVYPSGRQVTYRYAPDTNRLTDLKTVSFGGIKTILNLANYDDSGRPHRLSWLPGSGLLVYAPNNVTMHRTFDAAGREEGRTLTKSLSMGGSTMLRDETYGYDGLGRLETITSVEGTDTETLTYNYSVRDVLEVESHDNGKTTTTLTYDYDTGRRRTSLTRITRTNSKGKLLSGSATSYSFDTGNRLSGVTESGTTTAIDWNTYGQQTSGPLGQNFDYNLGGQLETIDGLTIDEEMLQDAMGIRVQRTVDDGTTTQTEVYLSGQGPDQVLHRIDPSGATTDIVRTPTGQIVARLTTSGIEPVVINRTGSPYWTPNSTDFATYSAFGELESGTEIAGQLGFHGMMRTDNGVLFAGVRAYDSSTGRFMSTDPLDFAAATDINDSADLYGYALGNPVHYKDATGYRPRPGTYGYDGEVPRPPGLSHACKEQSSGGCINGSGIIKYNKSVNDFKSLYRRMKSGLRSFAGGSYTSRGYSKIMLAINGGYLSERKMMKYIEHTFGAVKFDFVVMSNDDAKSSVVEGMLYVGDESLECDPSGSVGKSLVSRLNMVNRAGQYKLFDDGIANVNMYTLYDSSEFPFGAYGDAYADAGIDPDEDLDIDLDFHDYHSGEVMSDSLESDGLGWRDWVSASKFSFGVDTAIMRSMVLPVAEQGPSLFGGVGQGYEGIGMLMARQMQGLAVGGALLTSVLYIYDTNRDWNDRAAYIISNTSASFVLMEWST